MTLQGSDRIHTPAVSGTDGPAALPRRRIGWGSPELLAARPSSVRQAILVSGGKLAQTSKSAVARTLPISH